MPNFIQQVLDQFRAFWQRLLPRQRVVFSIFGILILSLLAAVTVVSTRPTYSPLFTGLSADDAASIVTKLKDKNIPYRIGAAGASIFVPQPSVYETRLELASEGLPQGAGVGFEIFEKPPLTITDFTQKINYLRALQGELARTIMGLSPVEFARVHLVMPEPELYTEKQNETTASVVLKLKPAAKLTEPQIRGIMHLVSRAVEGLKPQNVDVIDVAGNVLSDLLDKPVTNAKFEAEREYERRVERDIQTMLDKVLGPNRAVARVQAEIDFTQSDIHKETFEPVVGKEGILRSEQRTKETFTGQGQQPGGVPGITTNIPGYPTVEGGQSNYKREETVTNYEVNKTMEKRTTAPGIVKRLSVAVIVDSVKITTQMMNDIRRVVRVAGGLDNTRGDQVQVVSMRFSREEERLLQRALDRERRLKMYQNIAAASLIVLVFLFVLLSLRAYRARPEEIFAERPVPITELERELELAPTGAVAAKPATAEETERERRRAMYAEIEKLSLEKPDNVARLLRGWLMEEIA